MADAGSREIRTLLTSADGDLDANLQAFGEALPEDDAEAPTPDSPSRRCATCAAPTSGLAAGCARSRPPPPRSATCSTRWSPRRRPKLYARGLRAPDSETGRQRIAEGAGQTQDAAAALADATKALA